LAKDIFTLKKDGAKRHQQIINLQFSIFNSGLSGLGIFQTTNLQLTFAAVSNIFSLFSQTVSRKTQLVNIED